MSKDSSISAPLAGFHFMVMFDLSPSLPIDFRFQEVSGLSATITPESIVEGGENRFTHHLPKRPEYTNLVLKRGLFTHSRITNWCRDAIENFEFSPVDVYVSLLNSDHLPVANWQVIGAYPVKWSVSNFNAEENSLAIETIELTYQYFKTLKS